MQVLILAAGYGTRLYPLTKDKPKPLLPCNGKPIINYLLDKVKGFDGLRNVIVVTNDRFTKNFEQWAKKEKSFPVPVHVVNDGTTTPENRLGAVGDIDFVLKKNLIAEDLLVMGGDNLFDYELSGYVDFCKKAGPQVTIGLFDIKNKEWAKSFGVVQVDNERKIVSFEEKPKEPRSTLIAMCLYYIPKDSFNFVSSYLGNSKSADTTGEYINWLSKQTPVFGFKFDGKWYDIGSLEAYNEAQEDFKQMKGR